MSPRPTTRKLCARGAPPARQGFSLVELLVVIAIVALLSALLLPGLARAKQQARAIQCRHQQRQITLGYHVALDHDPEVRLGESAVGDWWVDEVGRPDRGWICPSAPLARRRSRDAAFGSGTVDTAWYDRDWNGFLSDPYWDGLERRSTGVNERAGGYAFNGYLLDEPVFRIAANARGDFFQTETRVLAPAQTPVVADAVVRVVWPRASHTAPVSLHAGDGAGGTLGALCIPRHTRPASLPARWPGDRPLPGATQVAFFDGHVERVRLEGLWSLRWHWDYPTEVRRPGLR